MKHRIPLFIALIFLSQLAKAQTFIEGTHYSLINSEVTAQTQEVVEYFSFSCPGCYAMEPHLKTMDQNTTPLGLRRVHVPFGGSKAKLSQKAFVIMKLLNAEEHKDSIFRRIHEQRDVFNSENELLGYFESLGYERKKAKNALDSFSADVMLKKMNKEAAKNQIRSIPTIIVNGKYQVNTRAIFSGTNLAELVKYLNGLAS